LNSRGDERHDFTEKRIPSIVRNFKSAVEAEIEAFELLLGGLRKQKRLNMDGEIISMSDSDLDSGIVGIVERSFLNRLEKLKTIVDQLLNKMMKIDCQACCQLDALLQKIDHFREGKIYEEDINNRR